MSIYEEVEIEDMEWEEEEQQYTYPCPCGDKFIITLVCLVGLWWVMTGVMG
jgi:ribosomal protein L11 methylase PrmA